MNAPVRIKGWCPGARRPMQSGDGLIVRIRIPGGRLDPHVAKTIAGLAKQHGNGALDLTQRGNLQIRGVSDVTLPPLIESLDALGLLQPDAGTEQSLNIVESPLNGFDPAAVIDSRALGAALEGALQNDTRLRALPPKFSFLIDDGGAYSLGDVAADIRLEGFIGDSAPRVALRLAGDPDFAAIVSPEFAAAKALSVARAFLDLRERSADPPRRMRALVERAGARVICKAAGISSCLDKPAAPPEPSGANPRGLFGVHAVGQTFILGAAAPFGVWSARDLDLFANIALQSSGTLRLTPCRSIAICGLEESAAEKACADLAQRGFIVDSDDPRLAIVACAGAPACSSAEIGTREMAESLASLFTSGGNVRLHITGCAKGCARPRDTEFALVGRDGAFDLVAAGRADSAPALTGLGAAAARRALIERIAR